MTVDTAAAGLIRCRACGTSGGPHTANADAGWFRCEHCGAAAALDGADAWAFEAPGGRMAIVRRAAGMDVELGIGSLFRFARVLPPFILGELLAVPLTWLGGRLDSALTLTLSVAANAMLLAWLLVGTMLVRTRQHLRIRAGRLSYHRVVAGVRWGRVEVPADGASMAADGRLVRIFAGGRRIVIRCSHPVDARWLVDATAPLLRGAVLPEGSLACPGCGAPVGTPRELSSGGRRCPYCRSTLAWRDDRLVLGPVQLPEVDGSVPGAAPAVLRRDDGSTVVWRVRPFAERTSFGSAAAVLVLAAGFAAVLPVVPWALRGLITWLPLAWGLSLLLCLGLAGASLGGAIHAILARRTIRIDPDVVAYESRLLGFRTRAASLPIARLSRVLIGAGTTFSLQLETTSRELSVSWFHPGSEPLRRQLRNALAARLRAIGREMVAPASYAGGLPAFDEDLDPTRAEHRAIWVRRHIDAIGSSVFVDHTMTRWTVEEIAHDGSTLFVEATGSPGVGYERVRFELHFLERGVRLRSVDVWAEGGWLILADPGPAQRQAG